MPENIVSSLADGIKSFIKSNAARKERSEVTARKERKKYNLASMPPKDAPEVPGFFGELYERSVKERDRLGMPTRWMANYVLARAKCTDQTKLRGLLLGGHAASLSLGLIGANIERTAANITARSPVASVQTTSGDENISSGISAMCEHWNNAEEQGKTLELAAKIQETYGTVVEKAVLNRVTGKMSPVPLDITAFLPCPGKFHDIQKMPYCCHQYIADIDQVEALHPHAKGLLDETNGLDQLFLLDREEATISSNERGSGLGSAPMSGYTGHQYSDKSSNSNPALHNKTLLVEVWVRDNSSRVVERDGKKVKVPLYPGGIRMIKLGRSGRNAYLVLFDGPNPNVNWALTYEQAASTFLFDKYPFYEGRSYTDTEMFWGYSQAETTGDIAQAIDELWRMVVKYLKMSLFPPVIIPQDTGLDKSHFAYQPRLVLQPNSYQTSLGIRFMEMPAPPAWIFQALDVLVRFFDRTSQIEDVDRGDAPSGIVAASAIQMLQERAAVLVRAKIRAVDSLVRNRGRCFISMLQNFHVEAEMVNVSGTGMEIAGIQFLGSKFAYIVESGSTVIKTEAEDRQQAIELFQLGAIDQVALLETVKFRGWRQVVERMAQAGPLEQAMQILVQAGMPEEVVTAIYEFAMQDQGGAGAGTAQGTMQSGGVSNAQNGQPFPVPATGGQGMRGNSPQRQNGGAPAKPGVPMANQKA